MKHPIGFASPEPEAETLSQNAPEETMPKPSVVQVYFPQSNRTLAYYNDRFPLSRGDMVFVDGKLQGIRGYVTEITYNFKIHLEDYKRVIGRADTRVRGTFYPAGSHYITFTPGTLPPEQVKTWFKAPDCGEFICGNDDSTVELATLQGLEVTKQVFERGHAYYVENKVRYLSLNGTEGYALAEGSQTYEITFRYDQGLVSQLTCDCFCSYTCKHDVAVLLQLRELLEEIENHYAGEFEKTRCFAAVFRGTFMEMVLDNQKTGSIALTD